MKIRYRDGGSVRSARLEYRIVLAVSGIAAPYEAEHPETSEELEIFEASERERQVLRDAGFAIRDAKRPTQRAA